METYLTYEIKVQGTASINTGSLPVPVGEVQTLFSDTLVVDFSSDEVSISSAKLESGFIRLKVDYNVVGQVEVQASCLQLRNANGQPFHVDQICTDGHLEIVLDLGGYSLTTHDDKVDIFLELTYVVGSATLPDPITLDYEVAFYQVMFNEIRGKFATVSLPVEKEWDFDLAYIAEHFAGTMTVLDPQVTCEIMNTFPIDANIVLQKAAISGPGASASLLATVPASIYVPASTNQFTPVPLPLASSITISPSYRQFEIDGTVALNTAGMDGPTMVLKADQIVHLRFNIVLPLKLKLDKLTFSDTLDFSGVDVPEEPAFSNLLLRLGIYNGLPLDFAMQGYFFDSPSQTIKDSLFTAFQPVRAAQNGVPQLTELFVSKEDLHAVQRMLDCDKVIIRAMLNTNGQPAVITADQTLKVELGAKFDVDVNVLVNNNKP
jgi:hypothetical protein